MNAVTTNSVALPQRRGGRFGDDGRAPTGDGAGAALRGQGPACLAADANTIDELVGNVLSMLLKDHCALLRRYKPDLASLGTYLAMLARREVINYWRERERRKEEVLCFDIPSTDRTGEDIDLQDEVPAFKAKLKRILTRRESEYYSTHMEREPTEAERQRFTPQGGRKMKQRIVKKIYDLWRQQELF
jgi:hypothetical protein